ncbi:hypothetical protein ACIQI8_38965 [Streptomyces sp. NPDC092369]
MDVVVPPRLSVTFAMGTSSSVVAVVVASPFPPGAGPERRAAG